jgi:ribonuclease-3
MNRFTQKLGHVFRDPSLLKEALTHPSFGAPNYERLEFLGDSVLSLLVTEYLLTFYPKEDEGALAKRRAQLVRGETLAKMAEKIHLGDALILGDGEEKTGGRENVANLENAFEALLGAMYLDGGLKAAKAFLLPLLDPHAASMAEPPRDSKTLLQEWAQSLGLPLPHYTLIEATGPAHAPLFLVEVSVEGKGMARGSGASKKVAEQDAAGALLAQLGEAPRPVL